MRVTWADSGYAGRFVDWAADQLNLAVRIRCRAG
jgi:hypothetical protein